MIDIDTQPVDSVSLENSNTLVPEPGEANPAFP